ncbi:hypothetical protein B0H16DRAFT_1737342 [Mycena metata]|uniref:Uncharacterized protein n=1 Tax=Mycena metata TaxID=1033252 RepID=A0AAD7HLM3_9AGAR|nr:hypothetical protein B0H16DRAFT_1737342 [Mycena metata]
MQRFYHIATGAAPREHAHRQRNTLRAAPCPKAAEHHPSSGIDSNALAAHVHSKPVTRTMFTATGANVSPSLFHLAPTEREHAHAPALSTSQPALAHPVPVPVNPLSPLTATTTRPSSTSRPSPSSHLTHARIEDTSTSELTRPTSISKLECTHQDRPHVDFQLDDTILVKEAADLHHLEGRVVSTIDALSSRYARPDPTVLVNEAEPTPSDLTTASTRPSRAARIGFETRAQHHDHSHVAATHTPRSYQRRQSTSDISHQRSCPSAPHRLHPHGPSVHRIGKKPSTHARCATPMSTHPHYPRVAANPSPSSTTNAKAMQASIHRPP